MAGFSSVCAWTRPDPAGYDYTARLAPPGWAWEFLRRNSEFRRAADAERSAPDVAQDDQGTEIFRLERRVPLAENWGLRFFPDPDLPAGKAPIFWLASAYPKALSARPFGMDSNIHAPLRLAEIPGRKRVLLTAEGRAKLSVEGKTFAALITFDGAVPAPPEALTLALEHGGLTDLDTRLRALKAFIDYCHRRFKKPSPTCGYATERLKDALIALDAKLSGASLRQIAEMLIGAEVVAKDWNEGSRFTRERARRAVSRGLALMSGEWRELLR